MGPGGRRRRESARGADWEVCGFGEGTDEALERFWVALHWGGEEITERGGRSQTRIIPGIPSTASAEIPTVPSTKIGGHGLESSTGKGDCVGRGIVLL